jgi:acetyl-CoA synthetase
MARGRGEPRVSIGDIEALIGIGKFEPPGEFREKALLKNPSVYDEAKRDFEGWWERQAEELHWFERWERVLHDSEPPFQ